MHEPDGFREFVEARSGALVRAAWLLTGNEPDAQDLVQMTLVRTWSRWANVRRRDAPEAYARRVMMSLFLSGSRRRWRGEVPVAVLPEPAEPGDALDRLLVRDIVLTALQALPPRQRAVITLRFLDDLTETQVADALRCSVGTVKSQGAKAMATLRTSVRLHEAWEEAVDHDGD